ncbi:MAG: hypothetical protein M1549_01855 [Candidatus Dependentiae bacterium]|nr:hypothetical protein [Candidatus Dependentiae bacterium]
MRNIAKLLLLPGIFCCMGGRVVGVGRVLASAKAFEKCLLAGDVQVAQQMFFVGMNSAELLLSTIKLGDPLAFFTLMGLGVDLAKNCPSQLGPQLLKRYSDLATLLVMTAKRKQLPLTSLRPMIIAAACLEDFAQVRALALLGADLRGTGYQGETALHWAALSNDFMTVTCLVFCGLGEQKDKHGAYPHDLTSSDLIKTFFSALGSYGAESSKAAAAKFVRRVKQEQRLARKRSKKARTLASGGLVIWPKKARSPKATKYACASPRFQRSFR